MRNGWRETRGVYFTPDPVVSCIVRSVDQMLRRDFGVAKGLADSSLLARMTGRRIAPDDAGGWRPFWTRGEALSLTAARRAWYYAGSQF